MGIIREVGDGVAKIEGLTDAKLNEMIDFGHGITGLALNLEETEVGAIILGDYTQLEQGDEVRTTGKAAAGAGGQGTAGSSREHAGRACRWKGSDPERQVPYPVEKIAPGIIRRRPVRPASTDRDHAD